MTNYNNDQDTFLQIQYDSSYHYDIIDNNFQEIRGENTMDLFENNDINEESKSNCNDYLKNIRGDENNIDTLSLLAELSTRDSEDEIDQIIENMIKENKKKIKQNLHNLNEIVDDLCKICEPYENGFIRPYKKSSNKSRDANPKDSQSNSSKRKRLASDRNNGAEKQKRPRII